jgi:hypothetical protein
MELEAWLVPCAASGAEVRKDGEKWNFDVLARLLAGRPIGRIVGAEAMKFGGWQRLNAEYAKQFGVETPGWPSRPRT